MTVEATSETKTAEAEVIIASLKDGVDPERIRRALKLCERTFYRRKALAERLRADRERDDADA